MHKEQLASKDHLPFAEAVLQEDLMMDTHAQIAQPDRFKIQTTLKYATLQFAVANMTSNYQWIVNSAENVNHANGQDRFQTMKELDV